MEWVILFVVSWILFFIFINWKKLKYNLWSGLAAVTMQLSVDTNAITHNFYRINRPTLAFMGSSVFFILGPVFTMAALISQYHPKHRWLRIINVMVFTLLYTAQEYLLLKTGALEYIDWHLKDSLLVNIGAMIIISWVATVVLKEKGVMRK